MLPRLLLAGLALATGCAEPTGSAPLASATTDSPNRVLPPRAAAPPSPPAPVPVSDASPGGEARACLGLPKLAAGDAPRMCEVKAGPDGKYDDKNVYGEALATCSTEPMTGWYRDGHCSSGPRDRGVHVVCAQMTEKFLTFTKDQGNDLSTPAPEYGFPGLKPGDRWCLCATRWEEARRAGFAPEVVTQATHAAALRHVEGDALLSYGVDARSAD